MKNLKKEQGITLIALIITIIVMLILVAVTITVALQGGLFDKATKAAAETEKNSILEQIIQMATYGNNGYIDVEDTYAKVQAAFPGKVGELGEDGVFTVQGKYGTYEYLLTKEIISLKKETIPGPGPIPPGEDELVLAYEINASGKAILRVVSGMDCKNYTIAAINQMAGSEVLAATATDDEIMLALTVLMGVPQEDVETAVWLIREYMLGYDEDPSLSTAEWEEKIIQTMPIMVADSITKNGVPVIKGVEDPAGIECSNGDVIVCRVGEKIGSVTITKGVLLGEYVRYEGIKWRILYNDSENGLQLITADALGSVTLGSSDDLSKAIADYNDAVTILTNECKEILKDTSIPASSIRNVGGPAADPEPKTYWSTVEQPAYNESWFTDNVNVNIVAGRSDESTSGIYYADKSQLYKFSGARADNGENYLLSERGVNISGYQVFLEVYLCVSSDFSKFSSLLTISQENRSFSGKFPVTGSVRPVVSVSSSILTMDGIASGEGTSDNPYVLK